MADLPTLDAVTGPGWFDTHKSVVFPQDCDAIGHMNVSAYIQKFDAAEWHLVAAACGHDPKAMLESGLGMAALEQRIKYLGELREGELIAVKSAVVEVRTKTLCAVSLMFNGATGRIAAALETWMCGFDLTARRAMAWPDDFRSTADAARTGRPNELF